MKRLFALLLSAALLCALAPIAGAGTPAHTIQVCGTELTAANGYTYTDANGGTAQYDPAAATLTLTNLNVSATAGPGVVYHRQCGADAAAGGQQHADGAEPRYSPLCSR